MKPVDTPAPSWYRQRLAKSLCRCGKKVARGKTRCRGCLKRLSKEAKDRYARYVLERRCRRCPLAPLPGRVHCSDHDTKAKVSAKKAMKRFVKKRRDEERCVTCGRKSKTYNCPRCRKKFRLRVRGSVL